MKSKKATKNVQNLSKGVFFIFTVAWGTRVLNQTDYNPWYLFGSGKIENLYKNHPLNEYPPVMKYYYLGTLGYYIAKTFEDILMREKRNDFMEMVLHHTLTIELYVGSYMCNFMGVGSLVILALDWTQIFVGLSRGFTETKFKTATVTFGVGMWVTWIYFRLYVYPTVNYYGLYSLPREIPGFNMKHDEMFVVNSLFWLNSGMMVLNIWWAYLITKLIIRAAKGKDNDIVNKVEN